MNGLSKWLFLLPEIDVGVKLLIGYLSSSYWDFTGLHGTIQLYKLYIVVLSNVTYHNLSSEMRVYPVYPLLVHGNQSVCAMVPGVARCWKAEEILIPPWCMLRSPVAGPNGPTGPSGLVKPSYVPPDSNPRPQDVHSLMPETWRTDGTPGSPGLMPAIYWNLPMC